MNISPVQTLCFCRADLNQIRQALPATRDSNVVVLRACCVAPNKILVEIAFPRGVKRRIVTRDQSILNLVRVWYNV